MWRREWFTWLTLFVVTLFAYGHNYWFNSWHFKWTLVLFVAAFMYAERIGKEFHWSAIPALAYTLWNALWIFSFRDSPYSKYELIDQLAFAKCAAYSATAIALLAGVYALVNRRVLYWLRNAYGGLCLANSLYVIMQSLYLPPYNRGGFIGNASINACLIAFTYPFFYSQILKRKWDDKYERNAYFGFLIVPVIAILLASTSMGLGTLLVGVGAMGILEVKKRGLVQFQLKYILPVLLVSPVIVAVSYLFLGKDLFHDSGRFYTWGIAMDWLFKMGNPVFGSGLGSAELLLPMIQHDTQLVTNEWFIWMHNDWLQIFFELGAVGISLVGFMYFHAVKASLRSPPLFGALMAVSVCALGNYPLHSPILSVAAGLILTLCFRGEEHEPV